MHTEETHCVPRLEDWETCGHTDTNADIKIDSTHVSPASLHVVEAFIQRSLWFCVCIFSAGGLSGNKIKGWNM